MKNAGSKIQGYSLLELIITMAVLAILVMGTIPLVQNSVKRQKEQKLRDSLAMMRLAIDEFKRDTIGMTCQQGAGSNPIPGTSSNNFTPDPRSRVVIDDCKMFESKNPDRYPPTLEMLAEGIKVKSRTPNLTSGRPFDDKNATEINEEKELKKVYLREIPVDPMTGEKDTWKFRSCYQEKDSDNWDEANVFDVRSGSDEESMNGDKYSEW